MGIIEKMFGRKKPSMDEFVDALISLESQWAKKWNDIFDNKLKLEGDGRVLNLEAHILSLFILTISLKNNDVRDKLHNKFCDRFSFSEHQEKLFLERVDIRYKRYFKAVNKSIEHMLPNAIIKSVRQSNGDTMDIEEMLLTNGDTNLMIYINFMEMYKATLGFIDTFKKDFKIDYV
jgi:hypothetical protein